MNLLNANDHNVDSTYHFISTVQLIKCKSDHFVTKISLAPIFLFGKMSSSGPSYLFVKRVKHFFYFHIISSFSVAFLLKKMRSSVFFISQNLFLERLFNLKTQLTFYNNNLGNIALGSLF
jgi:hypothetical protein